MSLRAALIRGQAALTKADIEGAARDMRYLVAHVLGISASEVPLLAHDDLTQHQSERLFLLVEARILGQPISQIIGKRRFWGRDFVVSSDVLDPRPETEFLIKAALEKPFERLLDLGTGSGVILLTLLCERPKAIGLGCDISPKALKVARQNADVFGIGSSRVKLLQSNWFANITGKFDLIVANPPYISSDEMRALDPDVLAFEPHIALSPGGDGLACYRIIARDCASFLRPLGRLIVEIGSKQGPDVCAIFARHGLLNPLILKDFDGRDRILQANAAL